MMYTCRFSGSRWRRGAEVFRALATSAAFAAALSQPAVAAEPTEIFRLTDPRGDDHGDGSLRYPRRDDLRPGDLDMVSFAAREEKGGTFFEVTFARPIRRTEPRAIDEGGTLLTDAARLGFYTFNIDVYIDTDRKPGSGNVQLLPGRLAEVQPEFAWEKCIALTPRPWDAGDEIKRVLTRRQRLEEQKMHGKEKVPKDASKEISAEVRRLVDEQVFFPTVVQVNGPKIRFFVPGSFLGGSAKAEWAYLVFVTGANINQKLDLVSLLGLSDPAALPGPYLVPVAYGSWESKFGTDSLDELLPPIVDLFVPPGASQEKLLGSSDPAHDTPVRLPAVVPAPPKK